MERSPHTDNTFRVGDRVKLAPELDLGRKLVGTVQSTRLGRLENKVRVRWDGVPWLVDRYHHTLRLLPAAAQQPTTGE